MNGLRASLRRTEALIRKESLQIRRDPSSIIIGVVLPTMLILLFGYGLSLDVRKVPVALDLEAPSPLVSGLVSGFRLSPYFEPFVVTDMHAAERLMESRTVDGIVRVRSNFPRQNAFGLGRVQLIVHGADANRARIIESYAEAVLGAWAAQRQAEGYQAQAGPVIIENRLWFNAANDSHYFLVPGLIVLVMTLIGAFLTTMVVAREWERGTLEALFVTPVRVAEILLGKTLPYFAMGLLGLALCVFAARVMFHVPFRGSFLLLGISSILYLLIALGIGLLISSAVRSQFVASQLTLLVTFLPAMMLSGFLFDIRSMPVAVRLLTYVLPARYFV
ncbi:MAG: ABC transporter permease, partial [Alphaproteobacteria bacterium]|nr:ABC transporter permease [Alphaproteobacteria bacterium]